MSPREVSLQVSVADLIERLDETAKRLRSAILATGTRPGVRGHRRPGRAGRMPPSAVGSRELAAPCPALCPAPYPAMGGAYGGAGAGRVRAKEAPKGWPSLWKPTDWQPMEDDMRAGRRVVAGKAP